MEWFFICIIGVIVALLLFSLLLGLGTLITRYLRLPNDPPFDALFSCPAPALVLSPVREQAQAQAAQQQQDQAIYDQAKYLCTHALRCHEAVEQLRAYEDRNADEEAALKALKPINKKLKDIPDKIEAWFKQSALLNHRDEIATWHKRHHDDCQRYQDILHALPEPSKKRLYLLIAALFISCSLLICAHLLANA